MTEDEYANARNLFAVRLMEATLSDMWASTAVAGLDEQRPEMYRVLEGWRVQLERAVQCKDPEPAPDSECPHGCGFAMSVHWRDGVDGCPSLSATWTVPGDE